MLKMAICTYVARNESYSLLSTQPTMKSTEIELGDLIVNLLPRLLNLGVETISKVVELPKSGGHSFDLFYVTEHANALRKEEEIDDNTDLINQPRDLFVAVDEYEKGDEEEEDDDDGSIKSFSSKSSSSSSSSSSSYSSDSESELSDLDNPHSPTDKKGRTSESKAMMDGRSAPLYDAEIPTSATQSTDGTLFNGVNTKFNVQLKNISICLILDESDIQCGSIENNISDVTCQMFSSKENEFVNLSISHIESRACHIFGSSYGTKTVSTVRLPFKPALVVDSLLLNYKGFSRNEKVENISTGSKHNAFSSPDTNALSSSTLAQHPPTGALLRNSPSRGVILQKDSFRKFDPSLSYSTFSPHDDSKERQVNLDVDTNATDSIRNPNSHKGGICGTVFIDFHLDLEEIVINMTPSLNAVFLGSYSQLSTAFFDVEELRMKEKQRKEHAERQEKLLKKRDFRRRKKTLKSLWKSIDRDGSNALDREEVKRIILSLFKGEQKTHDGVASRITLLELEREMDHFMDVVDENHDDEISFDELYEAMLRSSVSNNSDPKKGHILSGVLYFNDLEEFTSSAEVYRITGSENVEKFETPLYWNGGNGRDLFWELYERECGCSKSSLNGQDILVVQRKLVRAVLNYNFAKYCWTSLIIPELSVVNRSPAKTASPASPEISTRTRDATPVSGSSRRDLISRMSGSRGSFASPQSTYEVVPMKTTRWLLDEDSKAQHTSGAIERLAMRVEEFADAMEEEHLFRYDVSCVVDIRRIAISAGNALVFSKSLILCEIDDICLSLNSVLVPTKDGYFTSYESFSSNQSKDDKGRGNAGGNVGSDNLGENNVSRDADTTPGGLECHFEFEISVKYLNTDHDIMEIFIEPWSLFGDISFASASIVNIGGGSDGGAVNSAGEKNDIGGEATKAKTTPLMSDLQDKLSIKIHCPHFLNVDFAPPTIKTLILLQKIMDTNAQTYEKLSVERSLEDLREFWLTIDTEHTDSLDAQQIKPIVQQLLMDGASRSRSGEPVNEEELDKQVQLFIKRVDVDGDNNISFGELETMVRSNKMSANSVFENSSLIRLKNSTGGGVKFCSISKTSRLKAGNRMNGPDDGFGSDGDENLHSHDNEDKDKDGDKGESPKLRVRHRNESTENERLNRRRKLIRKSIVSNYSHIPSSTKFEDCPANATKPITFDSEFMNRQRDSRLIEQDYISLRIMGFIDHEGDVIYNNDFEQIDQLRISAFQKIVVPLRRLTQKLDGLGRRER